MLDYFLVEAFTPRVPDQIEDEEEGEEEEEEQEEED